MNVCCTLSGHSEIVQISESDSILNAYALLVHCTAGNAFPLIAVRSKDKQKISISKYIS
ncbi:hypothetical protein HMPREF1536_03215 [Parabacteroides gordonii MS-1 = DSM 23371]|jgi:hypothetical protein|uniref:Uncharacterized protein n=1 Tax=Parabacteroides gordonii MS-1 = DSM 23371 TaxID=1203610 RepID=A0A0F5JE06_9BACT|nr:hypothetical protein HMPREF1536_03215 [Parabacteroides gordonii MS-1 = DSM 23371]